MKAIVLAAGEGTRLRPLTLDRPKCLVPLWGRPILDYQLATFRRSGVADVVVVTGHGADALSPYGLRCRHNPRYRRTNMVYSLFCAAAEFDDDVVVAYGDIVFEPRVLEALRGDRSDFGVVVDRGWRALWEYRMDDPLADAETLRLDADSYITELGKKPRGYDDIEGQYIGLFRIGAALLGPVVDFYRALDPAATYDGKDYDNMFMTSFIDLVTRGLVPVKAVAVDHGWLEVDTPEDLRRYQELTPGRLFDPAAVFG